VSVDCVCERERERVRLDLDDDERLERLCLSKELTKKRNLEHIVR
jgi:hypothetical protein